MGMLIKSAEKKREISTISSSVDAREVWLKELHLSRRIYFFQKWADQRKSKKVSVGELFQWISMDLWYFIENTINLLLNLRKYGPAIRKEYGLSYLKQFYRMAYLVYVIRTKAARFRLSHLFEDSRWNRVRDYAFSRHIRVHNIVLGYPHQQDLEVLANKCKFYHHCKERGIPTPEIWSVYHSGSATSPSGGSPLIPKRDLFMKEAAGGNGRGAKKFTFKNGYYRDAQGINYSERELHQFFVDYSKNRTSILIQSALRNHDSWKNFTSGSLATCRVVTGISSYNKNEIIPFFVIMKMPAAITDIDNYSKGSIAANVDIHTGKMQTAVSAIPNKGKFTFDSHPYTGQKIKGEVLPFWNELIVISKRVHRQFKTISVGWDISLTEEGWTILEGNVEWGSDVIEGPSGKPIADSNYTEWFAEWRKRTEGLNVIHYKLPRR